MLQVKNRASNSGMTANTAHAFSVWRKLIRPFEAGLAIVTFPFASLVLAALLAAVVSLKEGDVGYGVFGEVLHQGVITFLIAVILEVMARATGIDFRGRLLVAVARFAVIFSLAGILAYVTGGIQGGREYRASEDHQKHLSWRECMANHMSDLEKETERLEKAYEQSTQCFQRMGTEKFHLDLSISKKEITAKDGARLLENIVKRCAHHKEIIARQDAAFKVLMNENKCDEAQAGAKPKT